MSDNEELAKQILAAYRDGKVDLTNVPELQKVVEEAVARASSTEEFRQKQDLALQSDRESYRKQMTKVLNDEIAKIQPSAIAQAVTDDLNKQRRELKVQQERFNETVETFEETSEKQQDDQNDLKFQHTITVIANFCVCLLLFALFFFVIGSVIYQGIWNGWGLHYLFETTANISVKHPYGALILGIFGFVLIAGAIFGSSLLMCKAVKYLTDLEAPRWLSKLFSWRRD